MSRSFLIFIACLTAFCTRGAGQNLLLPKPIAVTDRGARAVANVAAFEEKLESLRQRYHIPGLSAGIVEEGKLAWNKGFGYADLERKIVPDENTVYQIASVTKTFGSIIVMQLVQAGKIDLNDPIKKYGINLGGRWGSDERIEIKHLLTHTAMGSGWNGFKPGYSFRYNGDWYNRLGQAIQLASGHSFGELLMQNIILPLQLTNTAPSTDDSADFALTGYNKKAYLQKVARPYDWRHGQFVPVQFNYAFGPAAGVMSCVTDLAAYSTAIDQGKFLDSATWRKVFTPFQSPKGKVFQYGLGWFVKYYKGMKIVWHTGWWMGYSALLIRIPEKHFSFILLANSQDLSRPFYHFRNPFILFGLSNPFRKDLNDDLLGSAFGKAFLDYFWKNIKTASSRKRTSPSNPIKSISKRRGMHFLLLRGSICSTPYTMYSN